MPASRESRKQDVSGTYFVQDKRNKDELTRLTIQDHTTTRAMGGVWPEQADPTIFRRVLDIGCGSGSWLIEAAQTYPTLSLLMGIDISPRMIEYARAQAEAQQVADRVEFREMDALLKLEFPVDYFDLVNLRLGVSFLRTWDWPNLLRDMLHVAAPSGVIRLTDQELLHQCSSPALTRFTQMAVQAFYQSGHLFDSDDIGVIDHLARLLTRFGCQEVQTRSYRLEYRAGTPEGQAYYENAVQGLKTFRPFLEKWGSISDDYDEVCQQALQEIQQPDFFASYTVLTAWGKKPLQK